MMIRFATAAVAALLSFSTLAQQAQPADFKSWRISVDAISLDSTKTAAEGVSDSSTGFGLALDYRKGPFVGGFGMFGGGLDDENGFSQRVRDQNGNITTEDSSTGALSFFFEAGGSYLAKNVAYLELLAGFQSLSVSRSISNCSDCDSEDLDLSGGSYIKPRVRVPFGEKFLGSISYMSYLSGDIKNGVLIGFEGRF